MTVCDLVLTATVLFKQTTVPHGSRARNSRRRREAMEATQVLRVDAAEFGAAGTPRVDTCSTSSKRFMRFSTSSSTWWKPCFIKRSSRPSRHMVPLQAIDKHRQTLIEGVGLCSESKMVNSAAVQRQENGSVKKRRKKCSEERREQSSDGWWHR